MCVSVRSRKPIICARTKINTGCGPAVQEEILQLLRQVGRQKAIDRVTNRQPTLTQVYRRSALFHLIEQRHLTIQQGMGE